MQALQYSWFQQSTGRCPAHTAQETQDWLQERPGSAWCQCLRRAPDHPAPRTWPHRNSSCGVTSSLPYTGPAQGALRPKGGGEISGRLCAPPPVCRPKAEATLRRAKLCLKRNGGHCEHVLGAPRQSAPEHWICSKKRKIYLNRLSLGTRFAALSPIQLEIRKF